MQDQRRRIDLQQPQAAAPVGTDEVGSLADPLVDPVVPASPEIGQEVTDDPDEPGASPGSPAGLGLFDAGSGDPPDHGELADETASRLELSSLGLDELKGLASSLADQGTAALEPGIAMTVSLDGLDADNTMGINIRIAPNDTFRRVRIPIDPETMSPQAVTLLREANGVLGKRRAKKGQVDLEKNDGLQFLVTLSETSPGVRDEVLAALGSDLLDVFKKARIRNMWLDRVIAEAMVELVHAVDSTTVKEILDELLSFNPIAFNITTNRWEARLAWELLNGLPTAERHAILNDEIILDDDADNRDDHHELAGKANNKVEKNLSVEYRASSRFDTFGGDAHGQIAEGTAGEDTARQSLVAQALEPTLWSAGDDSELRAVLRMVIQAGSAPSVARVVAQHWSSHQMLLAGFGFNDQGEFVEDIQDETATNALQRTIAGLQVFVDVIGVWGLLAGAGGTMDIDLEKVERAFLDKYAGLHLAKAEPAEKASIGQLILDNAGLAPSVLSSIGVGPAEFLDLLTMGFAIKDKLQQRIEGQMTVAALTDDDPDNDPGEPNQLLIATDQATGSTVLSIAQLPIAGQAAVFGGTTVKLGASLLENCVIEIDAATIRDGDRGIRVKVAKARLTDMMMVQAESMMVIQEVAVEGLQLNFEGLVSEPANLLGRISHDIIRTMMQALQVIPAGPVFLAQLSEVLMDGMMAYEAISSISDGNVRQLGFSFSQVKVQGVHGSDGTQLDELTIDATSLQANTNLFADDLGSLSKEGLQSRQTEMEDERHRLRRRLADMTPEKRTGRRGTIHAQRIEWLDAAIVDAEHRIAIFNDVQPLKDELALLLSAHADRLSMLQEAARQEAKDEGASRWERRRRQAEGGQGDEQLEAMSSKISTLQFRIATIEGMTATGTIGAVAVTDASVSGMSVGSATLAETTLAGGLGDEGTLTASSASLEMTDVQIGGGRRDLILAENIKSALEERLAIETRATAEERELGAAEKEAQKGYDTQIAQWRAELASLAPLLDEYTLLRARLGDVDHPITALEHARLQQITETLSAPPSATVAQVSLADISMDAGVDADAMMTDDDLNSTSIIASGAHGGLDIGSATITDIGLNSEEGDMTIASVGAEGASIDFDGAAGGLLQLNATQMSSTGIVQEGGGDATLRRIERLETELAQIDVRLGQLGDGEHEQAQREALRARRLTVQTELEQAQEETSCTQDLEAFTSWVEAQLAGLTDDEGHDYSRAFSLKAANDSLIDLDHQRSLLLHGEKGIPGEVCLGNAQRYITTYEAGIADLVTRIAMLGDAPTEPAETVTDRSAVHFDGQDRGELEALKTAASTELTAWTHHKADLESALAQVASRRASMVGIQAAYATIMEQAALSGVNWDKMEIESPTSLSAFMIGKVAEAQRSGVDGYSVGSVVVDGVDVDLSGVLGMLRPDPELGTWGEGITVSSGDEGPMVESLTVTDVAMGDATVLEELQLSDLSGSVRMLSATQFEIMGLGIGSMSLSSVLWDSGSMGVDASSVTLSGISVDAVIDMSTDSLAGSISSFSVDTMDAAAMDLRYEDYLIHLGPTEGGEESQGKAALQALTVTGYDLTSGAWSDISLRGLNTRDLSADLGGGMKLAAGALEADHIAIGYLITEDQAAAAPDGETAEANRMTFDLHGISGDDLAVEMDGMDIQIDQIRNGNFEGISIDFTTGDMLLDDLGAETLSLGPVHYESGGMSIDILGGLDLVNARMTGSGRLLFNAEEDAELRRANPDQIPDFVQDLTIDEVRADLATLHNFRYTDTASAGATTAVIARATSQDFALTGYDYRTNALNLDLGSTGIDGLEVALVDDLSKTTLQGDFNLESLELGMVEGGPTTLDLSNLSSSGASVGMGEPDAADDERDLVTSIQDLEGVNAGLTMAGDAWSNDGAKTTFRNIGVGSATLGALEWTSEEDGATSNIQAEAATVSNVKITGYTVTRMTEQAGMMLPSTDMVVSRLEVGELTGQSLTLGGTSVDEDGEHTTSTTGMGDENNAAFSLKGIVATNIRYMGGVLENAHLKVASMAANAEITESVLGDQFGPALSAGGNLSAENLFLGIREDTEGNRTIAATVSDVQAADVFVDKLTDDKGSKVELELPLATLQKVTALINSEEGDDLFSSTSTIVVEELLVDEDGEFTYTAADDGTTHYLTDEMTLEQRMRHTASQVTEAAAMDAAAGQWAGVNVEGLLASIDGNITAWVGTSLGIGAPLFATIDQGYVSDIDIGTGLTGAAVGEVVEFFAGLENTLLVMHSDTIRDLIAPTAQTLVDTEAEALADDIIGATPWYDDLGNALNPFRSGTTIQEDLESWDDAAEQKRAQRDTAIAELERAKLVLDPVTHAAILEQVDELLWNLRNPGSRHEMVDAWLEGVHVDVSIGPWLTSLPVDDAEGVKRKRTLALGHTPLDFKSIGPDSYEAWLEPSAVAFQDSEVDDQGNSEITTMAATDISLGADFNSLFPNGQIQVYGSTDTALLANPIRGRILAGSSVDKLILKQAKKYRRSE